MSEHAFFQVSDHFAHKSQRNRLPIVVLCEIVMDQAKLEHRAVIKFLTKEGTGPKDIHSRMLAVFGDSAPSYFQVKYWSKQFKWGRKSIEDDPRSGRPVEVTSSEMCKKIEDFVMHDRRVKVATIAREFEVSEPTVLSILHERLGMSKVCSRWVPRMLTPLHKQWRVEMCEENLRLFESDPDNYIAQIVTGDETWVHFWDPETKQESMQWKHKGSPTPKKVSDATICRQTHGHRFLGFTGHFAYRVHGKQENNYW